MKRIVFALFYCLAGASLSAQGTFSPDTRESFTQHAEMLTENNSKTLNHVSLSADVVVCGGGLSGVCAAVSAARHGAKVILIQDRPVLGGNASSEMRMGIVGVKKAQWHEAGILEEMQLRNFRYNPLLRYTLWDDVIYSTVVEEANIKLLLNTSVNAVTMDGSKIAAVQAWNGNSYTKYTISGTVFADCTGDGILRLSGAKFRRGREFPEEFGENYMQSGGDARTMGNSILLQLRKTDADHPFTAPSWAYHFTDSDFDYASPKSTIKGVKFNYKRLYPEDNNFWWVEFGGNFDTIADANDIQYELKRIAYGVWEYIKNHPDGRGKGYELDWIGSLPGKRESTRFIGPHILNQNDILNGGHFKDVVAYGGWTLDDHDPDAFHKQGRISLEHSVPQGFGIPFDCLYSVNIENLMFAGRDISCTHMGLSATRVMATCSLLGQAVGTAAALAVSHGTTPAGIRKEHIAELQNALEDDDCLLPYRWRKVSSLTASAVVDKSLEPLRNGIDRSWDGEDNGVWLAPGEDFVTYTWKKPVTVSGARMIFDSDFKLRSKRMRKLEATTERVNMPRMMPQSYKIEALVKGQWVTLCEVEGNYKRLVRHFFTPVKTKEVRVIVNRTWGDSKAHIFAFDVL